MDKYAPIVFLVMPMAVHAEVSDKMPSIAQLWLQAIVITIVLFALIRWSVWFSIPAFLVISFFGMSTYELFAEPHIHQAILNEQGTPYVVSMYGSIVLMFIGSLVGIWSNRKKTKGAVQDN